MTETYSAIVAALAALLGVIISQAWTAWYDRSTRMAATRDAARAERRSVLLRYMISTNKAIDLTRVMRRKAVATQDALAAPEMLAAWNETYERLLEVRLTFPTEAARVVEDHRRQSARWRDAHLDGNSDAHEPPHFESLLGALRPWYGLAGRDEAD